MTDHNPSVGSVTEFEGEFVRVMEGKMPSITIGMPEGYHRGMHLLLNVEVRVRNISMSENRDGDLVRSHAFAIENAALVDAFHPDTRPETRNVGGSATSEGWRERLLKFIEGEDEHLEIDEDDEMPERLRVMLGFAVEAPNDLSDLSDVPVDF